MLRDKNDQDKTKNKQFNNHHVDSNMDNLIDNLPLFLSLSELVSAVRIAHQRSRKHQAVLLYHLSNPVCPIWSSFVLHITVNLGDIVRLFRNTFAGEDALELLQLLESKGIQVDSFASLQHAIYFKFQERLEYEAVHKPTRKRRQPTEVVYLKGEIANREKHHNLSGSESANNGFSQGIDSNHSSLNNHNTLGKSSNNNNNDTDTDIDTHDQKKAFHNSSQHANRKDKDIDKSKHNITTTSNTNNHVRSSVVNRSQNRRQTSNNANFNSISTTATSVKVAHTDISDSHSKTKSKNEYHRSPVLGNNNNNTRSSLNNITLNKPLKFGSNKGNSPSIESRQSNNTLLPKTLHQKVSVSKRATQS
jgi:hypothetical protein